MIPGTAMLRTWRRPPKLFSDFNTLQFASVMVMVVLVPLVVSMVQTPPFHCGGPELPKVSHPISMAGAAREDALSIVISRDGRTYFGTDEIDPNSLLEKIAERLKDRGVERKVYIRADIDAQWRAVKPVLDGVRSAGILRVAFLADQRRATVSAHP